MSHPKKILISTGIYPPEIGGPSFYAQGLENVWKKSGFDVRVSVFSKFNFLPTFIRHLFFMMNILPNVLRSDLIIILDTFSCAFPTVILGKIFGKKMILRTGGDFLWESYVERTGDFVLLRDFYSRQSNFSLKEKVIFRIIKFILSGVSAIVWSTSWQKEIFIKPYSLEKKKHFIIENYYGEKLTSNPYSEKVFVCAVRDLKWKNTEVLKEIFEDREVSAVCRLDTDKVEHSLFLEKIKKSYAVILTSLGDISPNTILDAIRCSKPFIVTKEIGIYERIKEIAIFVDPENKEEIKEKILWLCDEENYSLQKKKVESFNFTHSWEEIAGEFLEVYNTIK